MSDTLTAIYLRETNHVLAAYTQKAGSFSDNAGEKMEQLRNGLPLRLLPRALTHLIVTKSAIEGKETIELTVESPDKLKIPAGSRYRVAQGTAFAEIEVLKDAESPGHVGPFTATLEIKVLNVPSAEIPHDVLFVNIGKVRSPFDEAFTFAPRHVGIAKLETYSLPLLSRPHAYSIDTGKAIQMPGIDEAESIAFLVTLTGVELTLQLKTDQSIGQVIPAVCVLRTPDKQNAVATGVIRKSGSGSKVAKGEIPFAAIPGGVNHFLFMVKGLPPMWDNLGINEQRTWSLK